MKNMQAPRAVSDSMKYEDRYSVELARGGSHIASTRSLATMQAAIADVLDDFVTRHGVIDSIFFLDLLAKRLENRGSPEAAMLVRRVAIVGIDKAFAEVTHVGKKDSSPQVRSRATVQRSLRKTR